MKTGDLLRSKNSTFVARCRSDLWWLTLPSDSFPFFVYLGENIIEDWVIFYTLTPRGTVLRVFAEDLVSI